MGKNFSLKLALNNIRNHRKFYLPYFLASVGIIAMFYIICFLAMSRDIAKLSANLSFIMGLGVFVMAVFAFIFLFYTNSFLMKRRKKEIGLYNILGMEKRHIGRILIIENVIVSGTSIAAGLLCGILFSKLVHLFLTWVFGAEPPFGIEVSVSAMGYTFALFGILFVLTTVSNQMSIRLAKPIELLYGGNVGEKEPKSKWLLAIIGFICLGSGYFIAITTESPLDALMLFFVAVILVIIGTYCLFTAGSIAILKTLRKNKKFYYKPGNFTAVSGLIYRMKQNAAGLANICILSTMVLVMVSGTVSLYFGMQDMVKVIAPGDVNGTIRTDMVQELNTDKIEAEAEVQAEKAGIKIEEMSCYKHLTVVLVEREGKFVFEKASANNDTGMLHVAAFLTEEDYTALTGEKLNLSGGEIAVNSRKAQLPEDVKIGSSSFKVKKNLDEFLEIPDVNTAVENAHYVVVADNGVLEDLYEQQLFTYEENASSMGYQYMIDTNGTEKQNADFAAALEDALLTQPEKMGSFEFLMITFDSREELAEPVMGFVGGFLFLGVFLGIVFTFAAALIIYYKQISEGYYDKEKFEIMQKVGMSKSEVRRSIRRQVLLIFFVPLIMAGIHILAAFKMITKLLLVFSMTNVPLFALCTLGTFLVFAVIYALVYMVTAREYYKIVG